MVFMSSGMIVMTVFIVIFTEWIFEHNTDFFFFCALQMQGVIYALIRHFHSPINVFLPLLQAKFFWRIFSLEVSLFNAWNRISII